MGSRARSRFGANCRHCRNHCLNGRSFRSAPIKIHVMSRERGEREEEPASIYWVARARPTPGENCISTIALTTTTTTTFASCLRIDRERGRGGGGGPGKSTYWQKAPAREGGDLRRMMAEEGKEEDGQRKSKQVAAARGKEKVGGGCFGGATTTLCVMCPTFLLIPPDTCSLYRFLLLPETAQTPRPRPLMPPLLAGEAAAFFFPPPI